jgi:hypothetical protein
VERAARANKAGALRDNLSAVMAGHSRSKNGVLSHAYVPAIHVLAYCKAVKTWMP